MEQEETLEPMPDERGQSITEKWMFWTIVLSGLFIMYKKGVFER